jgi:hypothetical protein
MSFIDMLFSPVKLVDEKTRAAKWKFRIRFTLA